MKKVAYYTLGCKLNFSETSALADQLSQRGHQQVAFQDAPDVYIINTCSVTENANKKCRKVIREALKISPHAYIAIVGCYAQLKPKEISEIPGVDIVLGAKEKFELPDLIKGFTKSEHPKIVQSPIDQATEFNHAHTTEGRTRTFLKVQDGCDYSCAFCTIPLARGKSRSDTIDSVRSHAQKLLEKGTKEIVLTGVNIGDYGLQNGSRKGNFLDLVKSLDQLEGDVRIRISSIEPNLLSKEIIEFVAHSKHFMPHFHIPMQSGSNKILKSMRRRYLKELYQDRITYIHSVLPNACIGADVIVGFPGEGEAEFQETVSFIDSLNLSYLHVFSYSQRENTVAVSLPDQVESSTIHKRSKILREYSKKYRQIFYDRFIGSKQKVLFEQDVNDGFMHGFTENYIRVCAPYDPIKVNTVQQLVIGERIDQVMESYEVDSESLVKNDERGQSIPSK